jgi:hypothetical protein
MRFLLRLFAIFVVVYTALTALRRIAALLTPGRSGSSQRSVSGGRLVKDPVCGTYIPAETAVQAHGQFFCGEECRRKYSPL